MLKDTLKREGCASTRIERFNETWRLEIKSWFVFLIWTKRRINPRYREVACLAHKMIKLMAVRRQKIVCTILEFIVHFPKVRLPTYTSHPIFILHPFVHCRILLKVIFWRLESFHVLVTAGLRDGPFNYKSRPNIYRCICSLLSPRSENRKSPLPTMLLLGEVQYFLSVPASLNLHQFLCIAVPLRLLFPRIFYLTTNAGHVADTWPIFTHLKHKLISFSPAKRRKFP